MVRASQAGFIAALLLLAGPAHAGERRLLDNAPGSGGVLHGLAVAGRSNYFISNGNGSWTYSFYSSPNPNGNNANQGAGVSYPPINGIYEAAVKAFGAGTCPLAFTPAIAATAITPTSGTIFYDGSETSGFVGGITQVAFPSRNLGVAVGASLGTDSATPVACTGTANIIVTYDQGASWLRVTALPGFTPDNYFTGGGTGGAPPVANSMTNAPIYPMVTGGDFVDVFFANPTLGWAVGGNAVALVDDANNIMRQNSYTPGMDIPVGYILITTNGGTVWRNVPLFLQYSVLKIAMDNGVNTVTAALYAQNFFPGFLFSVQSDASGKHVYAVGAPGSQGTYSLSADEVTFSTTSAPTIIYSGNGGVSWVVQTTPIFSRATTVSLLSVAVRKGSTAWAVGGNLGSCNYAAGACNNLATGGSVTGVTVGGNGVILGTTNGGFSWQLMDFPNNANMNQVPILTTVALNGKNVWVGGFTMTEAYWPVAPTATVPGSSYTVLVSTDGVAFKPALQQDVQFPPGFVQSGPAFTYSSSTSPQPITAFDIHGIVWDNSKHGYMHGNGFIMVTFNAGRSWTFETPNAIILGDTVTSGAAFLIQSIANVPTTY